MQIAKIVPPAYRDNCRLVLFAFCGKRQAVAELFAGSLAVLPASARAFWLATADRAAGRSDASRRQFEELLPGADAPLRTAIERRLAWISIPPEPPDAAMERVVADAAIEHGQEEKFAGRRSLFSRLARATQIFIALNLLMFAVETCLGGGTNLEVLYRLGALSPPAVFAGQWWRLILRRFCTTARSISP